MRQTRQSRLARVRRPKRFFISRIAREDASVVFDGFGVAPGLLEDDGFAEQRLLVIGELRKVLFDGRQRVRGAAVVDEGDA